MSSARRLSLTRAAQAVSLPGDWAEYGVAEGRTALILLELMPMERTLWLFDWWQGLPRAWGDQPRGGFRRTGARPLKLEDPRVRVVSGLFEETVRPWALEHGRALALVHVDCDLYESTRAVLEGLRGLLVPGTVVAFDEYAGRFGNDEERAWEEQGYQASLVYRGGEQAVWKL